MLQNSRESFVEKTAELEEGFGVHASEDLDVVGDELEWDWSLKLDTFSWGVGEKEPKIYVDDVSVSGDEYIAIMSIFYLEEIGEDRVSS
jgi:hypothetical protein